MILCNGCSNGVKQVVDNISKYQCEVCNTSRFSQTNIVPRLCDVCAVGKKQCQVCKSPINGGTVNVELEALNGRYQKDEFYSKIKGVTMVQIRQINIRELKSGQELHYIHEKDNAFDTNAIKLFADEQMTKELGYVSKELAPDLLEYMNKHDKKFTIVVSEVTGGTGDKSFGCNIKIKIHR